MLSVSTWTFYKELGGWGSLGPLHPAKGDPKMTTSFAFRSLEVEEPHGLSNGLYFLHTFSTPTFSPRGMP